MRVILGNGHLEFIRRLAGVIDRNLRRPLNRVPCRNETYRFQKKRRTLRTTLRCVIAPMLDHPHRTLSDLKNRGQNFEFLGWEDLVVARGKTAKNRIRRSFDVPYPRYPPAEVFERQFETLQSVPQAADADLDLAFSRKPYLKFLKCRIRNDRHPCAKCFVVPGELSLASGTPRQRLRLTSRPSTTKRLVDVGYADAEKSCRGIRPDPTVHGRNHTLTQIL